MPGYAKTDPQSGADRYGENNRLTRVRWVFGDGDSVVQNLDGSPDTRGVQTMRIPPVETDSVVLELSPGNPVHLQTFLVQDVLGQFDVARAAPLLVPALHALRTNQCDNDRLNRLILHAGLDWRAVMLLRTYFEHARQIGAAASRTATGPVAGV